MFLKFFFEEFVSVLADSKITKKIVWIAIILRNYQILENPDKLSKVLK